MAASGQITCVTPARLSVAPAGLVADSARWSRKMRPWFSGRHFSRCGTLGCTMRILMSGTVACAAERQAQLAEQGHGGERHQGHDKRGSPHAPTGGAGGRLAPQHRRQRKDQDGHEREAVDAEHGGALHQGERVGQRVAQRVPGKAAQDMAAQPFRGRQRQRQRQDAACAMRSSRRAAIAAAAA